MTISKEQENAIKSLLAIASAVIRLNTHPEDAREAASVMLQGLSELDRLPVIADTHGANKALAILSPLFSEPENETKVVH